MKKILIRIENITISGFEAAIRGMRNPMNSWDRSDSIFYPDNFSLGSADLALMQKLYKAGTDHRKFMRMITVYLDITAPLYWWKEFDTYKVGTTANSCSTMHKIHAKEFTIKDFSTEHLIKTSIIGNIINELNIYRDTYNNYDKQTDEYKAKFSKKDIWWQMIQLLPSSYNQKRTVQLNYEVLANICRSRKDHKLDEWREFCKTMKNSCFYFEEITEGENENDK